MTFRTAEECLESRFPYKLKPTGVTLHRYNWLRDTLGPQALVGNADINNGDWSFRPGADKLVWGSYDETYFFKRLEDAIECKLRFG